MGDWGWVGIGGARLFLLLPFYPHRPSSRCLASIRGYNFKKAELPSAGSLVGSWLFKSNAPRKRLIHYCTNTSHTVGHQGIEFKKPTVVGLKSPTSPVEWVGWHAPRMRVKWAYFTCFLLSALLISWLDVFVGWLSQDCPDVIYPGNEIEFWFFKLHATLWIFLIGFHSLTMRGGTGNWFSTYF